MRKDDIASRRYAGALFQVSESLNRSDEVLDEFRELSKIILENTELREFLEHPNITNKEKKDVIQEIFKDKVDQEIIQLVYILLEHDRLERIRYVYYDYKYLVYKNKHMKIAYVTTAIKMNGEETDMLKAKLSKKYNCSIEVQNIVDPGVIGGVYLRVGDRIIDGTIKGRFNDIKERLLDGGD
jgi:F-type H+-transporting ATPase subunit delta